MNPDDGQARSIALLWMEQIWSRRDLSRFDDIHGKDFVDHCPAGRSTDRAAYRAGIVDLFRSFPDFRAEVEDLVVDPAQGKAAIRWAATGTHLAPFLGFEETGRTITFRGIEMIRIVGGSIVERWGEWDTMELLDQLGRSPEDSISTVEGA